MAPPVGFEPTPEPLKHGEMGVNISNIPDRLIILIATESGFFFGRKTFQRHY